MFFVCVSGTKTATATDNSTNGISVLPNIKYDRKGNEIHALMEESETYPLSKNTITKTVNAAKPVNGYNAIPMPSKVATPFPPLKPAKTGKI